MKSVKFSEMIEAKKGINGFALSEGFDTAYSKYQFHISDIDVDFEAIFEFLMEILFGLAMSWIYIHSGAFQLITQWLSNMLKVIIKICCGL